MKAFEIQLDGEKFCTAGFEEFGSLFVFIDWLRHENEPPEAEGCSIRVFGWASKKEGRSIWGEHRLVDGDEVVVRVTETEYVDEPVDEVRVDFRKVPNPQEPRHELTSAQIYDRLSQKIADRLYGEGVGSEPLSTESSRENRRKLFQRLRAEFEVEPS